MIPSIDEILTGYSAGTYTAGEAKALIQQHIDAAGDRCLFAAHALEGMLATGIRKPSHDDLAIECFSVADAMLRARSNQQ